MNFAFDNKKIFLGYDLLRQCNFLIPHFHLPKKAFKHEYQRELFISLLFAMIIKVKLWNCDTMREDCIFPFDWKTKKKKEYIYNRHKLLATYNIITYQHKCLWSQHIQISWRFETFYENYKRNCMFKFFMYRIIKIYSKIW